MFKFIVVLLLTVFYLFKIEKLEIEGINSIIAFN